MALCYDEEVVSEALFRHLEWQRKHGMRGQSVGARYKSAIWNQSCTLAQLTEFRLQVCGARSGQLGISSDKTASAPAPSDKMADRFRIPSENLPFASVLSAQGFLLAGPEIRVRLWVDATVTCSSIGRRWTRGAQRPDRPPQNNAPAPIASDLSRFGFAARRSVGESRLYKSSVTEKHG